MDELDRRLVHALQVAPRAPWTALGPVVGADAVTLARRWDRLVSEGIVYVTIVDAATDDNVFAFVELCVRPGLIEEVVAALVRDPAVTTLNRTTGERTLIATVVAETVAALADWTTSALTAATGVDSARALLVTGLVADARSWSIRALTEGEVSALAADAAVSAGRQRVREEDRRALVAALSDDIRVSVAALASRVDLSQRVTRESLARLLTSGAVAVRIDVARVVTEWPVEVWFFLATPPDSLDRVVERLRRLPEQRVVATTVGRCTVVLAAWLRAVDQVHRLEAALGRALPEVQILDRSVVLRTDKHVGHLLDRRGRATGERVPFVPAAGDAAQ